MLSLRALALVVVAGTSALSLGGCSAAASPETGATTSDLNDTSLATGHYTRSGDATPGVLVDLVLKPGHQFEASGYAAMFWGPANEQSPITFSGSYKLDGDTLTLLTHKGNEYDHYTVTNDDGDSYHFRYTSDHGDDISFSMTYVDGDTTLPTTTSKDPGMPASVSGGVLLRCQGGMFGTDFAISKRGGTMTTFAGEPKVVDKVRLTQDPDEDSTSDWIHLAGSGTKADDEHNDYEVSVPAAAFEPGAQGVTVDIAIGNETSGVYTATQAVCDAVDE
jgi:hypothetical protein